MQITNQIIADQVTAAVEGGSDYWIERLTYLKGKDLLERPAYADPQYYEWEGDWFEIQDEDGCYKLNAETAQRGFNRLPSKRLVRILNQDADAEDADVWLQLALLGDIVYG